MESEGIYTGYKYYETRYEDQILNQGNASAADGATSGSAWDYASEMSYPFGYGLSYTTFEMKLDSVEAEVGGVGTATVTVTNTGSVAGKTAVQLYVQVPYTRGSQQTDRGLGGIRFPPSQRLTLISLSWICWPRPGNWIK